MSAQEGLKIWVHAEIHGVKLASVHGAEWPARMKRLLTDASHLMSSLEDLADRRYKLHSMVSCLTYFTMATNTVPNYA